MRGSEACEGVRHARSAFERHFAATEGISHRGTSERAHGTELISRVTYPDERLATFLACAWTAQPNPLVLW